MPEDHSFLSLAYGIKVAMAAFGELYEAKGGMNLFKT
jgi:hypothetical protein